jgi:hypothetical protein
MDELTEKALAIYGRYLKDKSPSHGRMEGWRDVIVGYADRSLLELSNYRVQVFNHLRIGDNGNCYIELPNAFPICFQFAIDRHRGMFLKKNIYGGKFCVGTKEPPGHGWLFPYWNPARCFEDLDVAIGMAYKEMAEQ